MLIIPVRKSIFSPDLHYKRLPEDCENCAIYIEVEIGQKDTEGADIFSFTAITPKAIPQHKDYRWGRGWLVIDYFDWKIIEDAVDKLCSSVNAVSWSQVSSELNKYMFWEFEGMTRFN